MKIAVLGTGLLGFSLSERILQSGLDLTVYNRTRSKADPLKKKGAKISETSFGAMSEAECIILMLSDAKAIEEVLFANEEMSFNGKTIIQMGTISPSESIQIQKKVYVKEGEYFECPVLGSRKEAIEGTLILLVGSTKEKFEKWEGLLKNFGPKPLYVGEVGKAAAFKLSLNMLIAAHTVSFSLSLGLIEKYNINVEDYADVLRQSALYAPMFDKKLSNWIRRDYANPNFTTKHLLKDLELFMMEAKDKDISLEVPNAIKQMCEKSLMMKLDQCDYSSLYNAVNNIK